MRVGSTLICKFVRSTSSHHRPWQIALAITAGVLLGILPKISLLFATVGLVCFVIPSHLPLLALTAVVVSFAAPLLESTLGRLGLWSLTHPQLAAFWTRLDSMPLVPWLGIHNTVVNGSLLLWVVASLPIYMVCLMLSKVLIDETISDEVASVLFASDASPNGVGMDTQQEIRPVTGSRVAGIESELIAPPIVIWDDITHGTNSVERFEPSRFAARADDEVTASGHESRSDEPLSAEQVAARAADMAAWAEELITDELLMDNRSGNAAKQPIDGPSSNFDNEEQWLIETTMEMVRLAERAVANQAAMKSKQSSDAQDATPTDSSSQETSEIQTGNSTQAAIVTFQSNTSQRLPAMLNDEARFSDSSIRREQMPHSNHRTHLDGAMTGIAGSNTNGLVNRPREEALHYLLRHLKDVQEKAQKQ